MTFYKYSTEWLFCKILENFQKNALDGVHF